MFKSKPIFDFTVFNHSILINNNTPQNNLLHEGNNSYSEVTTDVG